MTRQQTNALCRHQWRQARHWWRVWLHHVDAGSETREGRQAFAAMLGLARREMRAAAAQRLKTGAKG